MDKKIGGIVNLLMEDYAKGRVIDENKMFAYPDKDVVIDILEKLKVVIYPGYYRNSNYRTYTVRNNISILLEDIIFNLMRQTAIVLRYAPKYENARVFSEDGLARVRKDGLWGFIDREGNEVIPCE